MKKERIIMGNSALAEELLSAEELDELYKLDASESDPDDDEDDDEDEDDEEEEPEVMPQP
jgi:Ran GTPase-activating protein (RanGAP) involved in mRNA processing and transport